VELLGPSTPTPPLKFWGTSFEKSLSSSGFGCCNHSRRRWLCRPAPGCFRHIIGDRLDFFSLCIFLALRWHSCLTGRATWRQWRPLLQGRTPPCQGFGLFAVCPLLTPPVQTPRDVPKHRLDIEDVAQLVGQHLAMPLILGRIFAPEEYFDQPVLVRKCPCEHHFNPIQLWWFCLIEDPAEFPFPGVYCSQCPGSHPWVGKDLLLRPDCAHRRTQRKPVPKRHPAGVQVFRKPTFMLAHFPIWPSIDARPPDRLAK